MHRRARSRQPRDPTRSLANARVWANESAGETPVLASRSAAQHNPLRLAARAGFGNSSTSVGWLVRRYQTRGTNSANAARSTLGGARTRPPFRGAVKL